MSSAVWFLCGLDGLDGTVGTVGTCGVGTCGAGICGALGSENDEDSDGRELDELSEDSEAACASGWLWVAMLRPATLKMLARDKALILVIRERDTERDIVLDFPLIGVGMDKE